MVYRLTNACPVLARDLEQSIAFRTDLRNFSLQKLRHFGPQRIFLSFLMWPDVFHILSKPEVSAKITNTRIIARRQVLKGILEDLGLHPPDLSPTRTAAAVTTMLELPTVTETKHQLCASANNSLSTACP